MLSSPVEDSIFMIATVIAVVTVLFSLVVNSRSVLSFFVNLVIYAGYFVAHIYLGLRFGALAALCCALLGLIASAIYGVALDDKEAQ